MIALSAIKSLTVRSLKASPRSWGSFPRLIAKVIVNTQRRHQSTMAPIKHKNILHESCSIIAEHKFVKQLRGEKIASRNLQLVIHGF